MNAILLAHSFEVNKRQKNHLNLKGNFYFLTLLKILISTPLTPKTRRLVVHD